MTLRYYWPNEDQNITTSNYTDFSPKDVNHNCLYFLTRGCCVLENVCVVV